MVLALGIWLYPIIIQFVQDQNEYFQEVLVYTPDLVDLPMTHLSDLESKPDPLLMVDPSTGRLKHSGYLLRDKDIIFNRESVPADPTSNWLKEATKMRHQTLVVTFGPKKISISRLLDIGIN